MKVFLEYVHQYIDTYIKAFQLLEWEIVTNPDEADIRFVTQASYRNYKKPYVIISHSLYISDEIKSSSERFNVIIKTDRDIEILKNTNINFFKFYGVYHGDFDNILENTTTNNTINSYINCYSLFPNDRRDFLTIQKHLKDKNVTVNLFGWGNEEISSYTDNDLEEMIKSKFTLHIKDGYLCEAVRRSILCGTPAIMRTELYSRNYNEYFKNGIVHFNTDEEIENFLVNITDEEYLTLRRKTWEEGAKYKNYNLQDLNYLRDWVVKIINQ